MIGLSRTCHPHNAVFVVKKYQLNHCMLLSRPGRKCSPMLWINGCLHFHNNWLMSPLGRSKSSQERGKHYTPERKNNREVAFLNLSVCGKYSLIRMVAMWKIEKIPEEIGLQPKQAAPAGLSQGHAHQPWTDLRLLKDKAVEAALLQPRANPGPWHWHTHLHWWLYKHSPPAGTFPSGLLSPWLAGTSWPWPCAPTSG